MKPSRNILFVNLLKDSLYDESGVVCYEYGNVGEVTQETRIYALPFLNNALALSTQFTYDSWGRIQDITYPDNEVVSYAYDLSGQLQRICNNSNEIYLENVIYDKFGAKVSQAYGNGLVTGYAYDNTTRRLSQITVTDNGNNPYSDIQYTYDPVGNVTQVASNYSWLNNQSLTETFTYDASDQLVSASETQNQSYQLEVNYGNWGRIDDYSLLHTELWSGTTTHDHRSFAYPNDPYNLQQVQTLFAPETHNGTSDVTYTFGINGSLRKVETNAPNHNVEYYLFNSAANLKAYSCDALDFAYYGYNAANTRTYKLSMLNMNQWVNGQPQPIQLQMQQAMFYPNAYLNFNQNGEYTKHYYNGSERIASRLGDMTAYIYADAGERLENRIMRLDALFREELGGMLAYEEPEQPAILGNRNGGTRELVSPPVEYEPFFSIPSLQPIGSPDDIFYYHTNHLGSTAYVTDQSQNITQGFLYAPFGEITTEYNANFGNNVLPKYSFNAKELDEETGMYYYEARYYKPPVFTSRDPMMEKKPWLTPYHYCSNNPVGKIDPSGMMDEDNPVFTSDGTFLGCTKEGYTGMVLICDAPLNIPEHTAEELLSRAGGTLAFTYDAVRDGLSSDAKSNIWTHIVSQYKGKKVHDEVFSMNNIENGKIIFKNIKNANWGTSKITNEKGEYTICGTDNYKYETTVENIQASVVFHEWYGHAMKGYNDRNKNHSKCYEAVIESPLIEKVTQKYINFVLKKLEYYLEIEK